MVIKNTLKKGIYILKLKLTKVINTNQRASEDPFENEWTMNFLYDGSLSAAAAATSTSALCPTHKDVIATSNHWGTLPFPSSFLLFLFCFAFSEANNQPPYKLISNFNWSTPIKKLNACSVRYKNFPIFIIPITTQAKTKQAEAKYAHLRSAGQFPRNLDEFMVGSNLSNSASSLLHF